MFDRWYASHLQAKLRRPFVHLLFGARQTGKSTLVRDLLPADAVIIDLANPAIRSRYLARPEEFIAECRALAKGTFVFVDEAQSVPSLFDAVQHLYDADKRGWRFLLCGSSARKLRSSGANLLPGRSMLHSLYPLVLAEHPALAAPRATDAALPFSWPDDVDHADPFPAWDLVDRLAFGSLPGIVAADVEDRADLLHTYAVVHLEEEIRREAALKDWGAFLRFLQLAASESGQVLNYRSISQEVGISEPTVKAHYQLLEDMFVGYPIPAYTKSRRKNLLSTPKFLLFDLGIRHAAAGLRPSTDLVTANPGPQFEQWVGLELYHRLRYLGEGMLYHQRSKDGAEIDFIVERRGKLTPIEVKWTEHPTLSDARHLLSFIDEKPRQALHGYIVCRCSRPMRLHDQITALPWSRL